MQKNFHLTRAFQRSTHCQVPSPGVRYGTLGVPMGIIDILACVGFMLEALNHIEIYASNIEFMAYMRKKVRLIIF